MWCGATPPYLYQQKFFQTARSVMSGFIVILSLPIPTCNQIREPGERTDKNFQKILMIYRVGI